MSSLTVSGVQTGSNFLPLPLFFFFFHLDLHASIYQYNRNLLTSDHSPPQIFGCQVHLFYLFVSSKCYNRDISEYFLSKLWFSRVFTCNMTVEKFNIFGDT